jgi:GDP-4-dehydro-6-deoxy-D-mannose reductase
MGDEIVELPNEIDIRNRDQLLEYLGAAKLDAVVHLAAISHVGLSWKNPALVYETNVIGTANLVEGLLNYHQDARLLVVSSSEVYGRPEKLPIPESHPTRPVSPYAASKLAAEVVALQAFYGRSYQVVLARSFNHTGVGQSRDFVVPALVDRLLGLKEGRSRILKVGNVSARRDFSDVRDVVRAYRLLLEKGRPGEVYNVCSGEAVSIAEVIEMIATQLGIEVEVDIDKDLMRPNDVPEVVGDPSKLIAHTGFSFQYNLRSAIAELLQVAASKCSGD